MASARPLDRPAPAPRNRGFAKRVAGFAKRAAALPGFPILWLACLAAAVLMMVTGGFNTGALPLDRRIAFWALLMGWSALKWQAWFALTVRRDSDWMRAALAGAVLLNLLLPFEIHAALVLIGVRASIDPGGVWLRALAISGTIFPLLWLTLHRLHRAVPAEAPALVPGGLLDRARIAPEALAAIEAEDHYCRVRRRDGGDALIHYRFGDALGELGAIDGLQVHRGAWVAASAVAGAAREGRRWHLVLQDGTRVAVSATYLPQVRLRGWLRGKRL